jgi:hypothetical protein
MLLQAATAVATAPQSQGIPIGEWLAIIAVGITVAGAIYRTGVNSAETASLRDKLADEMKAINAVLTRIIEFMEESQRLRLDWAGFRREMEQTTSVNTETIAMLRARTHELGEVVNVAVGKSDLRHQSAFDRGEDHEKRITALETPDDYDGVNRRKRTRRKPASST